VKITGTTTLHAPPPQVWTALNDPVVLARTIPGCDHLEALGQDSYRLTITARVASTQGTYTGEASLTDRQEPTSLQLSLNAAGAPGTVSTSVQVRLAATADGTTELSYDADAVVEGMIAGVGQRLLATTAKRLADEFFASMDDALMGQATANAPAAAVAVAAPAAQAPGAVGAPGGVGTVGLSAAPPQGVRAGGAAGVASPADPATQGASGTTREPPTEDRQPAGRTGARPPTGGFLSGVLVGASAALAGTTVARLLRRRSR